MRNKKGFTGIEIALVVLAIGAVTWLCAGPVGKGVNDIVTGGRNKNQNVIKQAESMPVFDKSGKFVGNYTKSYESNKELETAVQTPFWKKVLDLGFWGVLLIVIGLACPITAPLILKAWSTLKADMAALQAKHTATVTASIDIAQAIKDGFTAYDAYVASYNTMITNTADPVAKTNLQATVLALQNARATLVTKMESEMDSATKATLASLQQAQATTTS